MTEAPSRSIRLFGTDEPVAPVRVLTAGPLSAELESGNLRYVRFGGIEMIRAISFIVRDRNWGTYNPAISNLSVEETGDGFRVSYDAVARDAAQELRYSSIIIGSPDGLRFEARGTAISDFETNRTGFVVLHPIAGVAGERAIVEQVDGRTVETRFPDLIEPAQPMMNLRAITHGFAPGATVTCRMEGDTYEMEDQRNWTDASYKTYVRPLALPWPYILPAGSELQQAVILSVRAPALPRGRADAPVAVRVGRPAGRLPPLGLGFDPREAGVSDADTLREIAPAHIICRHDPRRGDDRATLETSVAFAKALGATPWLEAVICELDDFAQEIATLGTTVKTIGSPFPVVLVSPAADLKCTLPGSPWPPCPPLAKICQAARAAFPTARLGGGMFSYFTELNRKRPPHELIDLVTFTTSAIVHAGDDRSVTEGLESLPYIARSVRAFIGDKPYVVGPSAIGMRDNPYGEAPLENPHNVRQAMNRNDPRQRGLLGAAWNLGYFAHFAYGGAAAVTLGGVLGAFGLVHRAAPWPQPWFDEHGGIFPAYHVVRGLSWLSGGTMRTLDISASREIQGIMVDRGTRSEIWLANLTGEPKRVSLEPAIANARVSYLDSDSFVMASRDAGAMDRLAQPFGGAALELDAYALARIQASST
jgi:hypothetical protein